MYSNVVTAIDKILCSYYVSTTACQHVCVWVKRHKWVALWWVHQSKMGAVEGDSGNTMVHCCMCAMGEAGEGAYRGCMRVA